MTATVTSPYGTHDVTVTNWIMFQLNTIPYWISKGYSFTLKEDENNECPF